MRVASWVAPIACSVGRCATCEDATCSGGDKEARDGPIGAGAIGSTRVVTSGGPQAPWANCMAKTTANHNALNKH